MDIKQIIYDFKPNNRNITNDTYIYRIVNLLDFDLDFENYESTVEFLSGKYTIKTVKSFATSIVVYLQAIKKDNQIIDKYQKLILEINNKVEILDNKNEATEKEKDNMISIKDIEEVIEKLKNKLSVEKLHENNKKYFILLQKYLVINLYHLTEPLSNDYINMLVYKTNPSKIDNEMNYISLNKKTITLNRYKTRKNYGVLINKIPNEMVAIIEKWIKERVVIYPELKNNRQLLINNRLVPMTQVNLTQMLNSIFGKNISSTMLRKIFLSDKYPVQHSIEEMNNTSRKMGHSVKTQQSTYRKKTD
jgi:hypothetical protein